MTKTKPANKHQNKTSGKIIIPLTLLVLVIGATAVFLLVRNANSGGKSTSSQSSSSIDNRALEVEVINPDRKVLNTFTEVTVIANKSIELVKPSNRLDLIFVGDLADKKYYVARVKNLGMGETTAKLEVKDEVGQTFTKVFKILKDGLTMPAGYKEVPAWPGAKYVLDANTYKGEINRQLRLLEDYEPTDLVDLNKDQGIYTFNQATLRKDAAMELKRMLDAMRKEIGKSATIASGYRSFNQQMSSHSGILIRIGEKEGLKVSARPGHSEHQLGTTVDITNDEVSYDLVQNFENTAAGKWLIANSTKYGFIRSLDEQQTDYIYEPWHFRYIGGTN